MRTACYTLLALVAFAANSILCRLALSSGSIDPASFSLLRFTSGAAALVLIHRWTGQRRPVTGSLASAFVLALYAVTFGFSYLQLSAGMGALILFGSVQVTMMVAAHRAGEPSRAQHWLGLVMALMGLVYLAWPGLSAPPLSAAALMMVAGVSWGVYTLRGRSAAHPLAETTGNFVRAVPWLLGVSLIALPQTHLERGGVILALASGVLASGVGYVIWYAALRGLTTTRAAVVQLSVPVLAATGGVLLLNERVTVRLAVSAALVLGGIALALSSARLRRVSTSTSTDGSR